MAPPLTLNDIDAATKAYAQTRRILSDRVSALTAEIDDAKRRKLPGIKTALAEAKQAESKLNIALNAAPELFTKPRTMVFHGVKVGWGKCPGKISWKDAATVVARIRQHFPKLGDVLIKTTEKPVRKALGQLSTVDLRKVGCEVVESGDGIVIKPTDSDVEKLVDQLLAADDDRADETED